MNAGDVSGVAEHFNTSLTPSKLSIQSRKMLHRVMRDDSALKASDSFPNLQSSVLKSLSKDDYVAYLFLNSAYPWDHMA